VPKAIVIRETGGPEVLRLEEREAGELAAAAVRVRVGAIGVNFIDVYFRTGLYPRPRPFVAGVEGAGVVEAVGSDVTALAAGDRVAWAGVTGSYAELMDGPADRMVRVPDAVPDDVAAAVMLQGMTADYLAHATWQTRPGDVALVHAAAGGVGLLLTQVLKTAGATVIGTCSSAEKEKLAREAGADHVVRYSEADFQKEARRITQGRGVDVVFDSVGKATFRASLASLRPRGMLVAYGQSSGPVPPLDVLELSNHGSLFLTRPSLAHYTQDRAELEQRAGAVLGAAADGGLAVRIGARFPLACAADAHRALEGRVTTGKVILEPSGP
jgi:NADPH2:quinone reductase